MSFSDSVFYIKIKDGHSFRSMLAMVKSEAQRVMMDLTEDTIDFEYYKKDIGVGYKISLTTQNFEDWEFKPRTKDIINGRCTIGIDVAEFYNATKGIGTRDSIIFYRRYIDDADPKISIVHVKASNKDKSESIILFSKIIASTDSERKGNNIEGTPNIKVQPKSFAEICNFINTTNCSYLKIDGFQDGAVMRGKHPVEDYKFVKAYGFKEKNKYLFDSRDPKNIIDTNEYNKSVLSVTNIPKKIVKSLAKFNNISNSKENGFIKFYFLPKHTVIKGDISNFGICSVFISNESREK